MPRLLLVITGLLAAAALAVAYASQHWGGLLPCPLCVWQRYPYWAALAVGLAGLALPRLAVPALAVMALLFLGNAALAAFHAGVEWGVWPSPLPECVVQGGRAATAEELLRSLSPGPAVPCDQAAVRLLGLSMAGWNAVYALAVGAGLTIWMVRARSKA